MRCIAVCHVDHTRGRSQTITCYQRVRWRNKHGYMSLYKELYGAMRSYSGVLSVMGDKRFMALLCQADVNHRDACFFHGGSHKMNKHIDISCACALQLLTGISCMHFNARRYMHVVARRAELPEEAKKKIGSTPL